MPVHPNGLWIWRLSRLRSDYLQALQEVGCGRVYLKVFDDLHSVGGNFWAFQCTPALISSFKSKGIEVFGWGYHFDQRALIDPTAQVAAMGQALACGLDGYVVDVEDEVKDPATHTNLGKLLDGLRVALAGRPLGYTSFGHPGKHPEIPWRLLDARSDLAFPQIYFEKFAFGASDEQEVQACIQAHTALQLQKPLLPIWGSESDTAHPASAVTLQQYLNRFPGSSLWRAPNAGEAGKAWELRYRVAAPAPGGGPQPSGIRLGEFPGMLGAAHILEVQKALAALGFDPGPRDGEWGPRTRRAVVAFQLKNHLSPDGIVGPITWSALGGALRPGTPFAGDVRQRLAAFAETEAARALTWTGPLSEAEKYLKPLREPMRRLGHIGNQPVFYDWCAAFVIYCCRQVGITIPDQPEGFWATMALVESWKHWARRNGTWLLPQNADPERGDIVCFEWHDGDASADHIGIVRGHTSGQTTFLTSEGNRTNRSGNFADRRLRNVAGLIRLRS